MATVTVLGPLFSARNPGLLRPNASSPTAGGLRELVAFSPHLILAPLVARCADQEKRTAKDSFESACRLPAGTPRGAAAPSGWPGGSMHNSINPLPVPAWGGAQLAIAHVHVPLGFGEHSADHNLLASRPRVYLSMLVLLSPDFGTVRRFSHWLRLPRIGATPELVQFPMSAVLSSGAAGDAVTITYGVDDCRSARLVLPLAQLDELLAFSAAPGDGYDGRTSAVPETSITSAYRSSSQPAALTLPQTHRAPPSFIKPTMSHYESATQHSNVAAHTVPFISL